MIEVTVEDFEKNFDAYIDRIEKNGEEFLIRQPNGKSVVAVPATNEFSYLWNHDDAS